RLKLVGFGERPGLVPEGNALFAPVQGVVPAPLDASATHVDQGSLEASNVDPMKGMVELVEVSRGFEQYMHAMQRLDEIAQRINVQGDYTQTGNSLDLAVEGTGFFEVTLPDGTTAFTRAGAFKLDNQSRMVTSEGIPLEPAISIPSGAEDITVGSDGVVSAI